VSKLAASFFFAQRPIVSITSESVLRRWCGNEIIRLGGVGVKRKARAISLVYFVYTLWGNEVTRTCSLGAMFAILKCIKKFCIITVCQKWLPLFIEPCTFHRLCIYANSTRYFNLVACYGP